MWWLPPPPPTLSPCLPVPPLSSPSLCCDDSDAAPGRRSPAVLRNEGGRKRAVECPAAEYGRGRGGCHVFVRMWCKVAGGRGGNPRPGGVPRCRFAGQAVVAHRWLAQGGIQVTSQSQ